MSRALLRDFRAAVAVRPPGVNADFITLKLRLGRLTALVGPNASGKTMALRSIGFLLSGLMDVKRASLAVALTKTMRPNLAIPKALVGTLSINEHVMHSSLITPPPTPFEMRALARLAERMMKSINIGDEARETLLRGITEDLSKFSHQLMKVLEQMSSGSASRSVKGSGFNLGTLYLMLLKSLAEGILGEDVEVGVSSLISKPPSVAGSVRIKSKAKRMLKSILDSLVDLSILLDIENVILTNTLLNGTYEKALILNAVDAVAVIKRSPSASLLDGLSLAVFHPGFVYSKGVFESLYYFHTGEEGLPREDEAVRLLREYIPWVRGYELREDELSLKGEGGRRVSVYDLSDGHRVAVFMSVLYAMSRDKLVFLIDTPEAFVHPDGLPVVADMIARMVEGGGQVVVATQSIEFLRELLLHAREYGVLSDTLVERIELSEDGVVRPVGVWGGGVSLESIEELGLDLRR